MKRIIALCLAMLLCVSVLCVPALAAGNAKLTIADVSAAHGEEVTVIVKLNNNPGIAGMDLVISYDQTRLEKVSYAGTGMNGGVWTIINHAIWDNVGDSTYNGSILQLKFRVKENAPCGKANVSVSGTAGNWDGNYVTLTSGSGSVNVTHAWGKWNTVTPATCNATGKEERVCSVCGEKESNTLAITGNHTWGAWTTVNPATCTEDGKQERVCSACGEKESKILAATGHKWGAWTTVKPATCTEDGKQERVCSACGEKESKILAATGHKWGEWKVVTPATCSADGVEERVCSACGEKENRTLPALGHDVDTEHWCRDDKEHWHECNNQCGEMFDVEEHQMEDKTNDQGQAYQQCTVCGYQTVPAGEIPDDVPQTGDISILFVGGALVLIAIAFTAVIIVKRKAV